MAAALLGLCETGDEVIVFDPTYDSYPAGIAMAGAKLRGVLLEPTPDGGFGFDPDVNAVKAAKQFLTFVNGAPFQPAIAVGLRMNDEYFVRFASDLQSKRDLLSGFLADAGFNVLNPEGTYFTTVDISPVSDADSISFCLGLPETAGVVAVPSARQERLHVGRRRTAVGLSLRLRNPHRPGCRQALWLSCRRP